MVKDVWSVVREVIEGVSVVVVDESVNEGTWMACAKTTETAILAFAGEGWGLNVVKLGYKMLNLEEMMVDVVVLLEKL